MPAPLSFDYAVVRVVPHVEREEFINVGVILFCRATRFLGARLELDRERLKFVDPGIDLETLNEEFDVIRRVCAGGPAAGALSELSQTERFRWMTSPRSTTVQTSPVHCGLCADPKSELDRLFEQITTRKA